MDIASLGGIVVAVLAIIIGMVFGGVPFSAIIDIPSVFVTVFGSLACVAMANPLSLTLKAPKLFMRIFKSQSYDIKAKILQIVSFSEKARRDGLLALEDDMDKLGDPFLKKALQLVVDGTDPEVVRNVMAIDLENMEGRHAYGRSWFESWESLAPAFGMIGTLLGLIAMLRNMGGDASAIGAGMAVALITTLYGSMIANMICIPTAAKLKKQTDQEVTVKQIMIEGTLSIQAGDNPRIVQEKLASYLDPIERSSLNTESAE